MTDDRIALRELLEKGSDATFLREMIGFAAQRRMALQISPLARSHGLASDTRLYRLVDRLRCSQCGARPSQADVRPRP